MADLPIYFDPNDEVPADERQRREKCLSKATFASKALAEAAAIQADYQHGEAVALIAYRCRYCEMWHLSRR